MRINLVDVVSLNEHPVNEINEITKSTEMVHFDKQIAKYVKFEQTIKNEISAAIPQLYLNFAKT